MAGGFALLTADAIGPGLLGGPQWGIFGQDGLPLIVADSTDDLSYSRDYLISDAPQEQGAFRSYNKVQVPFDAKVGFLTNQTRFQLLNTLEPILATTQLVAVVSPEVIYPSANLVHYDLRRTALKGKTLILVTVWAREVRIIQGNQAPPAQSTNAATPTASGQVQPTPAGDSTFQDVGNPTTAADANTMDIDAIVAGRSSGISFKFPNAPTGPSSFSPPSSSNPPPELNPPT